MSNYPTRQQVESAIQANDHKTVYGWYTSLPNPWDQPAGAERNRCIDAWNRILNHVTASMKNGVDFSQYR